MAADIKILKYDCSSDLSVGSDMYITLTLINNGDSGDMYYDIYMNDILVRSKELYMKSGEKYTDRYTDEDLQPIKYVYRLECGHMYDSSKIKDDDVKTDLKVYRGTGENKILCV